MCGEFIAEYTRKARKYHHCSTGCGVPIPPGHLYVKTFEKDGGDIMSSKWHVECREEFNNTAMSEGEDCMDPWSTWENGMPVRFKQKYVYGPFEQEESL